MARPPNRVLATPFHPFVVGTLLPLNLVTSNVMLFAPSDAIRSVVLMWAAATVLLGLTWLAIRRLRDAAIVTTFLLLGLLIHPFGWAVHIGYWGMLALIGLAISRRPFRPQFTVVLNVAALVMALPPLVTITSHAWWLARADGRYLPPGPIEAASIDDLAGDDLLPSIVHVVLDGYGGERMLRSVMGVDNAPFLNELERLGFAVARDAVTPYNQTLFAMASVFSGGYLAHGEPPLTLADPDRLRATLGQAVSDGAVMRRLAGAGYRRLFTDTGYYFFRFPDAATVSRPVFSPWQPTLFEQYLLANSFLEPLPVWISQRNGGLDYRIHRLHALTEHALTTTFYRSQPAPFVLYSHVLAPHPPFTVLADGTPTARWLAQFGTLGDGYHVTGGLPGLQSAYRDGYVAKLAYTNRKLLQQLETMIRDVPSPKVIIVHGDHGSGSLLHHDDRTRSCLNERFSTFLAVYSDDPDIAAAFANLPGSRPNIVNIYRMLFDARFGTELGLLEDKSFFVNWTDPRQPEPVTREEIEKPCVVPW